MTSQDEQPSTGEEQQSDRLDSQESTEQRSAGMGLWQLIGRERFENAATEEVDDKSTPIQPAETSAGADDEDETEPAHRPRSLWSLMEGGDSQEPQTSEAEPAEADDPQAAESEPERPQGLWAVMNREVSSEVEPPARKTSQEEQPQSQTRMSGPLREPVGQAFLPAGVVEEQQPVEEPSAMDVPVVLPEEPAAPPSRARPLSSRTTRQGRSRSAMASGLFGLASVPLCGLSLLPGVWTVLPATIAGFVAILFGLGSLGELRRPSSRQTGMSWAGAGIVLGLLGMFLSPLVVSPMGQRMRQLSGRQQATGHLETIGQGLLQYHQAHGRFPAGGTWGTDEKGGSVPMHSWMTAILPYIGETALYREIDFSQPYNAEVNFPVMQENVATFFAPGSSRRKIGRGFAVSHFAGVGGDEIRPQGGLVHLGVFDRNSHVSREDVFDGLSQTLIAGQVASAFSPWGEPGNWRRIGDGLNREIDGFGNAEGTGALFLRGDGSVRFYSNNISPRILKQLSSRDGGETVPERYW